MKPKGEILLDGDTLFLDNSSVDEFLCSRKFEYSRVMRKRPAVTKPALTFGSAIHLALKLRYRRGCGPVSSDTEARQMYLLEKFWEKNPTSINDYRTLDLAQQAIRDYNQSYRQEPFSMCQHAEFDSLVEEAFAVPIGTVGSVKVIWMGRIDMAVEQDGKLYVFDHKTTSMGGEFVTQDYYLSSQFKGYAWALSSLLKRPVQGAMVNVLVIRKPAKIRGKGNEFLRVTVNYDEYILEEWRNNMLNTASDILHCYDRGVFPMQTKACVGRYGRCEFFDVCTLTPAARLPYLESGAYESNTWTPFRDDELDVDKVLAIPAEQISSYTPPPQPETISLEDVMRSIV